MSSSRSEGANQAAVLARKADADAIAVRELAGNLKITDEIVGFHAQQAIEKWLKALMASRGMEEARIHDIGRLLQLLENDGAKLIWGGKYSNLRPTDYESRRKPSIEPNLA